MRETDKSAGFRIRSSRDLNIIQALIRKLINFFRYSFPCLCSKNYLIGLM